MPYREGYRTTVTARVVLNLTLPVFVGEDDDEDDAIHAAILAVLPDSPQPDIEITGRGPVEPTTQAV